MAISRRVFEPRATLDADRARVVMKTIDKYNNVATQSVGYQSPARFAAQLTSSRLRSGFASSVGDGQTQNLVQHQQQPLD